MTDTFTVARETTVAAPPERVYAEIVDLRRWQAWSPWEGIDPDLKREYTGAATGTGAVYAWTGNRKVGQGRMEIVEATAPSKVKIDLQFLKPFKARNETVFDVVPDGAGSRVVWTMTGKKTLMTKAMGVFKSMDDLVGRDFERGLATLKATAESGA
ncbi:MAG: SRPBCC family protein [Sporichthyaceae bacterium]